MNLYVKYATRILDVSKVTTGIKSMYAVSKSNKKKQIKPTKTSYRIKIKKMKN